MVADWIDGLIEQGIDPSVLVPGEWHRLVAEDIAVTRPDTVRTGRSSACVGGAQPWTCHISNADAGWHLLSSPVGPTFPCPSGSGGQQSESAGVETHSTTSCSICWGIALVTVDGCKSLSELPWVGVINSGYSPLIDLMGRSTVRRQVVLGRIGKGGQMLGEGYFMGS